MAFQKVATLESLWSGEMTSVVVQEQQILLINIADTIYAYADVCPHKRTPLSEGSLDGRVLTCATHQWEFDVGTGIGINPDSACLEAFAVKVENGDILVDVEQTPTRDGSVAPRRGKT
jgi:toluene monooxygenase system ferredoxin subunit